MKRISDPLLKAASVEDSEKKRADNERKKEPREIKICTYHSPDTEDREGVKTDDQKKTNEKFLKNLN